MRITASFERRLARELEERWLQGDLPWEELGPFPGEDEEPPSFRSRSAAPGELFLPQADLRTRSVVRVVKRPSVLIRNHSFDPPVSNTWQELLSQARGALEEAIPAIGRIESGHAWYGTGVLVAEGVVATNRHVALQFLTQGAAGWVWSPGVLGAGGLRIDFREEYGVSGAEQFSLVEVLHVEADPGPDLALFRVDDSELSTRPLVPSGEAVVDGAVAVVGYPSRVPGLSPEVEEVLEEVFGTIYEVKRLAPGKLLAVSADRLSHDCSTLGGNSGSAVLDLESGAMIGLHSEGGASENYAVPAAIVEDRVRQVA